MPIQSRDIAVFLVLVLSVPLQQYLVSNYSYSADLRTYKLNEALKDLYLFGQGWRLPTLSIKRFLTELKMLFQKDYSSWYIKDDDPRGECPAVEVIKYKNPKETFSSSPVPRTNRNRVKWRIGQVVEHKLWGYKAVIIGWDHYCKAPESWIAQMHGSNLHWRTQPNYSLLVHEGDRHGSQITYVPQENISSVTSKIEHVSLDSYFDKYDGAQYIPQSWLKAMYPLD